MSKDPLFISPLLFFLGSIFEWLNISWNVEYVNFFSIIDPGVQLWIVKNTANNNNSNKQRKRLFVRFHFLKSFYSFLQTIVAQPKPLHWSWYILSKNYKKEKSHSGRFGLKMFWTVCTNMYNIKNKRSLNKICVVAHFTDLISNEKTCIFIE